MRAPWPPLLLLLVLAPPLAAAEAHVPPGKFRRMLAEVPADEGAAFAWTGEAAYLFGGEKDPQAIVRYDPRADRAERLEARLPEPRSTARAAYVGGFVYLMGGHYRTMGDEGADRRERDDVLRFDPRTHGFLRMNATLPALLQGAAVAASHDGVWIFGGQGWRKGTDAIVRYDPVRDAFSVLDARLPSPTYAATALWTGDAFHVFGGMGGFPYGQPGERFIRDVVRVEPATGNVTLLPAVLPWSGVALTRPGAVWNGTHAILMPGLDRHARRPAAVFDLGAGEVRALGHGGPWTRSWTNGFWHEGAAYFLGGDQGCPGAAGSIVRYRPDAPSAPDGSNAPPVVDASLHEKDPRLFVNACRSTDPDGVVASATFEWGDGNVTRSEGWPHAEHWYAKPGVYVVNVTMRDDAGAATTQSHTVVMRWLEAPTTAVPTSPTAAPPPTPPDAAKADAATTPPGPPSATAPPASATASEKKPAPTAGVGTLVAALASAALLVNGRRRW